MTRPGLRSYDPRPMKRTLVSIAVLSFATWALAQEQMPAPAPRKPVKAAPQKKLTPAEERLVEVSNTKAKFMAAMGSCARPEECDPESSRKNPELVNMLKNAEDAFMEACVQCASDKDCEEERAKIRSGRGRFGYNVCFAKSTKPADKKAAEKKPAAPAKAPATPAK